MRWREGSTNYSSGSVSLLGSAPSICIYDNGTTTCDRGYSLNTVGNCFSQGIGTINSGDSCVSDYQGSLFSNADIHRRSDSVSAPFYLYVGGEESGFLKEVISAYGVAKTENLYAKDSMYAGGFDILLVSSECAGNMPNILAGVSVSAAFKILRFDSGFVRREYNTSSDYFSLDVFGTFSVVHPEYFFGAVEKESKIVVEDNTEANYYTITSGIGVPDGTINPQEDEDNPVSICVGDLDEPTIENITPGKYTVLNQADDNISFDVVDAIGGVDKSSVYITVSGNLTTQSEGTDIVSAGVPLGAVSSFDGDENRYSFSYNPSSDWAENERVYITATGTDQVPEQGGVPFSCTDGTPNPFGYSWYYKVENTEDLGASITALADTDPPYLTSIAPSPWLGGVDSTDDITFFVLDDHAGVDLSSLYVYINSTAVVEAGSPASAGYSVSPVSNGYYFKYVNTPGFSFGSRVYVRVIADDLYSIAPNRLDYSYYFDVVSSDTLTIDNFYPEVGITWDPELVDISVDITDRVYDVDDSGLYLNINGALCSGPASTIYGNRDLTAVSGSESLGGVTLSGSGVYGFYANGVTVSGSVLYGGVTTSGEVSGGYIKSLPSPYDLTLSGYIVQSYIQTGVLVSGVLDTTLVSGVNWDGKDIGSSVYDVDISYLYSENTTTTGTIISGSIGRTLTCHPDNDFRYQGGIDVLVHGENLNSQASVTSEQTYNLFYGYNVKYFDNTFEHSKKISVYLGVDNVDRLKNRLDYGSFFTTIDHPSVDMSASITGIAPWSSLPASIFPQGPMHRYGEAIEVEVYVEDVEGNQLGPYTFSYTIESE